MKLSSMILEIIGRPDSMHLSLSRLSLNLAFLDSKLVLLTLSMAAKLDSRVLSEISGIMVI